MRVSLDQCPAHTRSKRELEVMNLNWHGENGMDDLEPFVHRLINPNEYHKIF